MSDTSKNLWQKIISVMAQLDARVPKTGRNEFHGYAYVTEADLMEHIRPLMAEAGIVVLPSVPYPPERIVVEVERKGITTKSIILSQRVDFTLVNADAPEEREVVTIYGEARGEDDKGPYSALSGAAKYCLLKVFLVGTGTDPEADRTEATMEGASASVRPAGPGTPPAKPAAPRVVSKPGPTSPALASASPAQTSVARATAFEPVSPSVAFLGPDAPDAPASQEKWDTLNWLFTGQPNADDGAIVAKFNLILGTTFRTIQDVALTNAQADKVIGAVQQPAKVAAPRGFRKPVDLSVPPLPTPSAPSVSDQDAPWRTKTASRKPPKTEPGSATPPQVSLVYAKAVVRDTENHLPKGTTVAEIFDAYAISKLADLSGKQVQEIVDWTAGKRELPQKAA